MRDGWWGLFDVAFDGGAYRSRRRARAPQLRVCCSQRRRLPCPSCHRMHLWQRARATKEVGTGCPQSVCVIVRAPLGWGARDAQAQAHRLLRHRRLHRRHRRRLQEYQERAGARERAGHCPALQAAPRLAPSVRHAPWPLVRAGVSLVPPASGHQGRPSTSTTLGTSCVWGSAPGVCARGLPRGLSTLLQ